MQPGGLKDLVWYIWESGIFENSPYLFFAKCPVSLQSQAQNGCGGQFSKTSCMWFFPGASHMCTPAVTVHTNTQQLQPRRPRDVFVLISVKRDCIFISSTRLENVHSVSFPFAHIFSFLYRTSHLSLSHHSPLSLIAVNGIVTFMHSCSISQPVWTLASKGYHC